MLNNVEGGKGVEILREKNLYPFYRVHDRTASKIGTCLSFIVLHELW